MSTHSLYHTSGELCRLIYEPVGKLRSSNRARLRQLQLRKLDRLRTETTTTGIEEMAA
jgi:hypothetical protein